MSTEETRQESDPLPCLSPAQPGEQGSDTPMAQGPASHGPWLSGRWGVGVPSITLHDPRRRATPSRVLAVHPPLRRVRPACPASLPEARSALRA